MKHRQMTVETVAFKSILVNLALAELEGLHSGYLTNAKRAARAALDHTQGDVRRLVTELDI